MAKEADDKPSTSRWGGLRRQFEAFARSEAGQRLTKVGRQWGELSENHPLKRVGMQAREWWQERKLLAEERSEQAEREQDRRRGKGRPTTAIPHWEEAVADLKRARAGSPTRSWLNRYRAEQARHVLRFLSKQTGFRVDLSTPKRKRNYLRVISDRLLQEEAADGLQKPPPPA
jgi:hypothetical protein